MADDITIVVNAQDNFSGVLSDFGSIMTGIESVVNLASQAFEFAKDTIGDFVNSAAESEVALTKLETVLASTGDTFGITSAQLQDMATSMMNLSGFSDEAEMSAEAMLLRFENLNGIFPQALQLTNDLAVSLGTDLTSAAQTIGKALDDPASGIGRLNTQFKLFNETEMDTIKQMAENGDIAGAQALIMERLTEKVGGAAEAYGNTFSGSLAIAKEQLDNLKETIGTAFLPILDSFISKFEEALPTLQTFASVLADAISSGDFSNLFTTFEDGSNYLGGLIELFGIGEEKAYALGDALNSIATNLDFSKLTSILEDEFIKGIDNVDWNKIGLALNQALNTQVSINISDNTAISQAIGNAFTALIAGGFGYIDWESLKTDFWEGVSQVISLQFGGLSLDRAMWRQIGRDLVDGIKTGFSDGIDGLFENAQQFWTDYILYVKHILGISSPSTIFRQIGVDIVQGLIGGFTTTWNNLLTIANNALGSFLDLFGIDLSSLLGSDASGLGTAGGGVGATGGGSGGGTSGQVVNNYFYGTVYIGSSLDDANYDCPSPNPLVAASGNQLVATGF